MRRTLWVGIGLSTAGLAGYGLGLAVAYPGRALSLTALMAGIALAAVGAGGGEPG